MTLGLALLRALKNHGAQEIFGIPGDFILPLFKQIEESNILPLVTLSHEPALGFAADAAARFAGEQPGNVYSRYTNPTVRAFEERIAALEGAEQAVATASGMAAILAIVMSQCSAGDHVLVSRSVFGSTITLLQTQFGKFGVETTFVSQTDVQQWRDAIKPNTKLLLAETPSNPLCKTVDVAAVRKMADKVGALVVVEAKEKSGTMSTVGHAERYGKPVFAVPGSIFSPASAGTNALLRDGRAKAVCTAADLFGTLGLQAARPAPAPRETPRPLSENERLVLSCLGAKAQGVEELGVTYLGCFLHRAYFRWVDDGRPEEMFSDLASQAQEARCVRSAQIFAAALCALGAAMQFYTAWGYLYAAQIYEELYAELIAAGGPSVVAAWMPRIALEAVLGLSWLALAVWGASAAVRTHKKWKKIKDEQCICE